MRMIAGACILAALAGSLARGAENEIFQLDLQGRSMYSKYNFTDVIHPYEGVDSYLVVKGALWFETNRIAGPYLELIPVHATPDEFWWQRNVQANLGLQVYPFATATNRFLGAVRLYGLAAFRIYYDEPESEEAEDQDIQAGLDYYFDTILDTNLWLAATVYLNGGYRKTNFSLDDYQGFLWSGNITAGPKIVLGDALLTPCAILDWTQSPKYDERWWENFLRAGAGLRFYPLAAMPRRNGENRMLRDLRDRFQVFAEVLSNVAWLGDDAPDEVEKTDFRAGIAFSTGGFFR